MQRTLERVLYIRSVRNPAYGYVQGINDLLTPFMAVFFSEHLPGPLADWDPSVLTEEQLTQARVLARGPTDSTGS